MRSRAIDRTISEVQAIDVHAHFGHCRRGVSALCDEWSSGNEDIVVERARLSNTSLTIVSSMQALFPRGRTDVIGGNDEAVRVVSKTKGLLQWAVVNPLQDETYDQATELLRLPKCVGIKIHPEEHLYSITEQGPKIFAFAAENQSIILAHSGEEKSKPADLVYLANAFPEVSLIIAHLGCGWDGNPSHQVRAIQNSKHGNVFVDTSSASNITPRLLEWAVNHIGADRILFGTDSPLYFAPMQRARIDYAEISDQDKRLILCENAKRLFAL